MKGSQFLAAQAVNIGQNTFEFVVSLFLPPPPKRQKSQGPAGLIFL